MFNKSIADGCWEDGAEIRWSDAGMVTLMGCE